MKNHIDTYELYRSGKSIKFTVRTRVTMKDEVDIETLRKSINIAIKRYPYFRKEIVIDSDGAYNLIDNDREIVVIKTRDDLPRLGSKEVNKHLFYVDTDGKNINFNTAHSIAGGKGIAPLIETCLYQYVIDKYRVKIEASNIRKPDSDLLDGEDMDIDIDSFKSDHPLKLNKKDPGYMSIGAYLKYFLNPFKKNGQYYTFSFDSKDIMKYAKNNDSSVASAFIIFIFKALCKVVPDKTKIISAGISHNPSNNFGYLNLHSDILTNLLVSFKKEMVDYDDELLGTITRGQICLQSDRDYSSIEITKHFKTYQELDKKKNYFSKKLYALFNCSNLAYGVAGTYVVNYTGKRDFGELADYIESYFYIVDGHLMSEIASVSDKLFMSFMQLDKDPRYVEAIRKVFDEYQIPYKFVGPFITNHVSIELPKLLKNNQN